MGRLGVQVRTGETVVAIEREGEVVTRHGRLGFDAVVLASGESGTRQDFAVRHRGGFHTLADPNSFNTLREALKDYSSVAMTGSGPLTLEVADRISKKGVGVTLFAAAGIMGQRLGDGPRRRLESAISRAGVSLVTAKPDRIAGVDTVEAVLVGGIVFPCQALIVVPDAEPNSLGVRVRLGRQGGVVVDGEMRSSWSVLFAAGACAEIAAGATTIGSTYASSAQVMGEAAGANAAGGHMTPRISFCHSAKVFGTEIVLAGLSLRDALMAGFDAKEASTDRERISCSLVFDRRSLRVWGVQIVGSGAGSYSQVAPLLVSGLLTLDELVLQEFPLATDISPLVETAREGLRGRA